MKRLLLVVLCACGGGNVTSLDGGPQRVDAGAPPDAGSASVTGDAGSWLDADPCSWSWTVDPAPVLKGPRNVASDPTVVFENGQYRMVFSTLDVTSGDNLLAASSSLDGVHWADPAVVLRGQPGTWAEELESAELVSTEAGAELYFAGYRSEINAPLCTLYGLCSQGFPASIAVAASDGGAYAIGDIVLEGTDGGFDGEATYSPTIARVGAKWVMIYSGWCLRNCNPAAKGFLALLGATSSDGRHWVKAPAPILERDMNTSWRNRAVGEAAFTQLPNGRWVLAFTGFTDDRTPDTALALAWSATPLGPYTVCPTPFYVPSPPPDAGGLESGGVIAPEIRVVNGAVQVWFTSRNLTATSDFGYFIRYATAHP